MADIFISYARADRDKVEKLAAALEAEGYSVWWDRNLTGGEEFSKEIEQELHAAKAVIVAWSKEGAASSWVRDEASLARTEQKLFPIRLDAEKPPLGFQQFHTFDFSGWKGAEAAEPFTALVASIDKRTGAAHEPATGAASTSNGLPTLSPLHIAVGVGAVLLALVAFFVMRGPEDGDIDGTELASSSEAVTDRPAPAAGDDGLISLGVIPFINMSSDPEQEYFADGLTEELLNWLANVEGLKVPGRTASFQFKGHAGDFAEIGERLSAKYLLEGSVRARRVVTSASPAQLIEAQTGYHLWSETYDRAFQDLFALQDEVAQRVVRELLGEIPQSGR